MTRPLRINLVPQPLWGKSLAHLMPNWTEVRDKVCSCGCCAICDTKTNQLHAHEVWKYDDDNHTVDLDDIIPVCENCHMALHFGKANVDGKQKEALNWYCKVNGVSKEIARHQIKGAFEWWNIRSDYRWKFVPGIGDKVEALTGVSCRFNRPGSERFYLKVPFADKDTVKGLGGRWDPVKKLWWVSRDNVEKHPWAFSSWMIPDGDVTALLNGAENQILSDRNR